MTIVCILGLGYIGLPTAALFATHDVQVIGVDVNPNVLKTLKNGGVHIEEAGLNDMVHRAIATGNLVIESTPKPADVYIIAVPTPICPDKSADMKAVTAAARSIIPVLRKGNLVVLESTSPPGTTVKLIKPILEESGLRAGMDFKLAYSPERVLPGQILKEMVNNARVIGGIDQASAAAGRDLYAAFVKGDIMLTDATTAEMVKLMENTYRDVNIALANEFALIAESVGINVWEAIEIANHHPRVKILRPGPGVGGHCIAVDPWFLVEAAPSQAGLIRQARLLNDGMPGHVVETVASILSDVPNPVIACLGITFKPDVDDVRESPALEIVRQLRQKGYEVRIFDPHTSSKVLARPLSSSICESLEQAVNNVDLAVLLVDHKEFRALSPTQLSLMRRKVVLDTRGCLHYHIWKESHFEVIQLGVHNNTYQRVGGQSSKPELSPSDSM